MRVLVACEFSGVVRRAFRERGHDAWSCDLLPAEDNSEFHFQCDVLRVLDAGWDLSINHPPCTYLTNAGVRHLHQSVTSRNGKRAAIYGAAIYGAAIYGAARVAAMKEAAAFFVTLASAPIKHIAIENPIPHKYAREIIGDYDQLIQPWMFGHGETKATCLWLKNLPFLQPTHRRDDLFCSQEPQERHPRVHLESPGPDRWKNRSRTYQGIAAAMAEQWGNLHSNHPMIL